MFIESKLLELQLRGILRILLRILQSFNPSVLQLYNPSILQLKLELQLAGNRVIGICIYRTLMPTLVGKQLKQYNLFYAAHISLFNL